MIKDWFEGENNVFLIIGILIIIMGIITLVATIHVYRKE